MQAGDRKQVYYKPWPNWLGTLNCSGLLLSGFVVHRRLIIYTRVATCIQKASCTKQSLATIVNWGRYQVIDYNSYLTVLTLVLGLFIGLGMRQTLNSSCCKGFMESQCSAFCPELLSEGVR